MNTATAELLARPAPGSHIVYPCTHDEHVVEAVALYAAAGVDAGEAVILIATASHQQAIIERLKADAYDVNRLEGNEQLVFIDAADLLACVSNGGVADFGLFRRLFETVIKVASHDPISGRPRKVRLFGEMVSLLWGNNSQSALYLEELWNEVLRDQSVPLLCTYTLNGHEYRHELSQIAALHTHSISEGFAAQGVADYAECLGQTCGLPCSWSHYIQ